MSAHRVFAAAFFLSGALASISGNDSFGWVTLVGGPPLITITYPTGTRVQVELADTPQKRSRGLMFRKQLASNTGMLFVFEEAGEWSFWMKNTNIALDILWLGPDKRIIHVEENVPGCKQDPCPEYKPNKDALYVLELPAGSVKREQLAKGMKLEFALPPR
jgi:uncharacterized membrane protein (UPF0127 family)